MTPDIKEKLYQLLNSGIKNEAEVVYFLCQIRKLKEQEIISYSPHLKMCINCALHPELTRENVIEHFIDKLVRFKNFYQIKDLSQRSNEDYFALRSIRDELLFLHSFRNDLTKVLSELSLPDEVCSSDKKWHSFIKCYGDVIQDAPLVLNVQNADIKKVILRKAYLNFDHSPLDESLSFDWEMTLNDDSKFRATATIVDKDSRHWSCSFE